MIIELKQEVENGLAAKAGATGKSLNELANQILLRHIMDSSPAGEKKSPDDVRTVSAGDATLAARRQSMENIRALGTRISPAFAPPNGVRLRDWLHEGHRY